jgi:hypothetical protein
LHGLLHVPYASAFFWQLVIVNGWQASSLDWLQQNFLQFKFVEVML